MSASQPRQTLQLPPIVLGGSGFSYQVHPDPKSVPISKIIRHAFDVGIKAIDTSPYYDPSEHLLGEALANPEVTSRSTIHQTGYESLFILSWNDWELHISMPYFATTLNMLRYPKRLKQSVHFLTLSTKGLVRYVGVSGYDLDRLVYVAHAVREKYGRSLDVVQNWAQLTMQNTRLERYGIPALKEAQVPVICNSSPLASGLLRASGVPMGTLGDWYPSPNGLRTAVKRASDWTETQETTLPALRCDSL
ncbi:Aldo/keto reductase family protein [Aspergillus parasiticus SU-1]|uniref:Aldo/keto reductase family protein n=1 Tax=Aspergillus parasiticus (strain ATCC 56775 / NRRL 5862 / SRRC 143 / SU-1) TaxID=1403190 RepID=A0A0F0I2A7_ASPPU|nr:Aldo/keto reductase family protein [Aspergillus parasiticus SU-1]